MNLKRQTYSFFSLALLLCIAFWAQSCSSALITASRLGDEQKSAVLLNKGADVNEQNAVGLTALHAAVLGGNYKMTKLLLDHGGDPSIKMSHRYSGRDVFLTTAYAMVHSEELSNYVKFNPFLKAVKEDSYEYVAIIELLLERDTDIQTRDAFGRNALYWPAMKGNIAEVRYLLSIGVDRHNEDDNGLTVADNVESMKTGDTSPFRDRYTEFLPIHSEILTLLNSDSYKRRIQKPTAAQPPEQALNDVPNQESKASGLIDSAADCPKLKLAREACAKLPWPVSMGCKKMAESQFDHLICNVF